MNGDRAAIRWLEPDWPAPVTVRAGTTLRTGGVSIAPYATLNLGDHVGDRPSDVTENRRRLRRRLDLPGDPLWLRQVHGSVVVDAGGTAAIADGAYSREPGRVCAVLTADCLPLLICDRRGTEVAALHCGWRGLAAGVVEAGLARFQSLPGDLLAWLGPAISGPCYEIGEEVRAALLARYAGVETAFAESRPGHYHANLYAIARHLLAAGGVGAVFGGDRCTFRDADDFFSHRRDGRTGRMASLIWLSP